MERTCTSLAAGSCIEVSPGDLKCKVVVNSIALIRAVLPTQSNQLTKENMKKQILNLIRKVNMLKMSSVSLSCLVEEPSTKSERDLFINAFLTALKKAIYQKGSFHITHVRLVQEEKDTIRDFLDFFKT